MLSTALLLLLAVSQVSADAHAGHDHGPGEHDDGAVKMPKAAEEDAHAGHGHAPGEHDEWAAKMPKAAGEDAHAGHAPGEHGDSNMADDDHSGHDHGAASAPKGASGHMKAGGAKYMSASADQMCHWTYGKCTISKPYVADRLGAPATWGMCTEKNVEDALHAEGWDCASDADMDKEGMGCQDRTILHVVPGAGGHNMEACMPGQVPQNQEMAQQYWDAFDDFHLCLQEANKKAADCMDVTASSFMSQLEVIGMTPPEGLEGAIMAGLQECDAATNMAACNAVEPAAETEQRMAAAATAAQQTAQSPASSTPATETTAEPAPDGATSLTLCGAAMTAVTLAAVLM